MVPQRRLDDNINMDRLAAWRKVVTVFAWLRIGICAFLLWTQQQTFLSTKARYIVNNWRTIILIAPVFHEITYILWLTFQQLLCQIRILYLHYYYVAFNVNTPDARNYQAWTSSQWEGKRTWWGQGGQQDALCGVAPPPSPYLGWLATNLCFCNGQLSSEISCGKVS
jgi:hypothetical protein